MDGFKKNIRHITKSALVFLLLIFIQFISGDAFADIPVRKTAVFGITGRDDISIALTNEVVDSMKKAFNECGRFMPAANKQVEAAVSEAAKNPEKDIYAGAAAVLNLDLYVIATAYQLGDLSYCSFEVFPINPDLKKMKKKAVLQSRIKRNISLKAEREITLLHENLPVFADIQESSEKGTYLINAGEWHGLKNNGSYKTGKYIIRVTETGRFNSLVKIPGYENESIMQINIFPGIKSIIDETDDNISWNTVAEYGLDNAGGSEKKLIQGMCVMNTVSNSCVPGYGAFLATGYFGFKNHKADIPGVALSSTLIASHFSIPMFLTGFGVNFFPWIQDPDKTGNMMNLQKFLWISLPLTFTAAFWDQFTVQLKRNERLPPFFHDRDFAAGFFSLLIPGAGHFFKGGRITGWSFYFAEMITAAYAAYNFNSGEKWRYSVYALCSLKVIDVIYAYFAKPSYEYYNFETVKADQRSISIGIRPAPGNTMVFTVMISQKF